MGPSREACDRCHSMKTRCVRAPAAHDCVRCTRLGFDCHYSPPGKTGRPPGSKRKASVSQAKRQEKGSSTTPRSSTSPQARPVPCRQPRRSHSHSQPLPLEEPHSMFSSSVSTASSTNLQPADLDFMQPTSSQLDDDSMSLYFMDDFIAEVQEHLACSPEPSSPTDMYTTTMSASQSAYPDPKIAFGNMPTAPYASVPAHDDLVHKLLDMQTELAKINKCLVHDSIYKTDIGDIYRVTENLIEMLNGYNEQNLAYTQQSSSGSGVIVLMMSSCYVSLIQAYECVANMLRVDLHKLPAAGDGSTSFLQPHDVLFPEAMPSVHVGSVRLSMPQRAITEANLHLVGQTVQRLKMAMNSCSSRMAMPRFMQNHPAVSTGPLGDTVWASPPMAAGQQMPMADLTSLAMSELKMREDNLFGHLQTSAF